MTRGEFDMKKIGILIGVFLLMTLIGCTKKSMNTDKETISQTSSIQETTQIQTTSATDISNSTADNYVWEKLKQYAKISYGTGKSKDDGKYYLRQEYVFTPLCEEDNIASIEYYLKDGTGTFMDPIRDSAFGDNVINEPYLLKGNNQEGIYFSVYIIFENEAQMTNDQKVQNAAKILEKQHIQLTITYQDGSVKVRNIGFKLMSNSNYYNLDMYELTLKE